MPPRRGNDHPTILPYRTFPASDGSLILAVGNDAQFDRLMAAAGAPGLAVDARFVTNANRVLNRAVLIPLLSALTAGRSAADWLAGWRSVPPRGFQRGRSMILHRSLSARKSPPGERACGWRIARLDRATSI